MSNSVDSAIYCLTLPKKAEHVVTPSWNLIDYGRSDCFVLIERHSLNCNYIFQFLFVTISLYRRDSSFFFSKNSNGVIYFFVLSTFSV